MVRTHSHHYSARSNTMAEANGHRRSVHFDPAIPAVRPEERIINKKQYSISYLLWIPPLGLLGNV